MAELIKQKPLGRNFLWCADIQANCQEPLYVDNIHYSNKMNKKLAINIADLMLKVRLLSRWI